MKKHRRNDQSGPQCVPYLTSCKQCRAHFKYFQVQTHVQTARESPDLNMDFRSFDNGCKQLYELISMQEYLFTVDITNRRYSVYE